MITKKYFPADKNYLLKEAQHMCELPLNGKLIDLIKKAYFQQFNPLGIEDDFIRELKKLSPDSSDFLTRPYQILAAIYRYQYGDNQLEFLWDGTSHVDQYKKDWDDVFCKWIEDICLSNPSFTRAFTKYIYSQKGQLNGEFIEKFLTESILKHFRFKIYLKKGLVPKSA